MNKIVFNELTVFLVHRSCLDMYPPFLINEHFTINIFFFSSAMQRDFLPLKMFLLAQLYLCFKKKVFFLQYPVLNMTHVTYSII